MGNKFLDGTALTIAIIGAINWALIGLFRFDLVAYIFGDMSWLSRIIYAVVGVCGLYLISFYMHLGRRRKLEKGKPSSDFRKKGFPLSHDISGHLKFFHIYLLSVPPDTL